VRAGSGPIYPGLMRHPGQVTRAAISLAMWPVIITLSPAILVVGEPVNEYVMRRVRRSAAPLQAAVIYSDDPPARVVSAVRPPLYTSLLLMVICNPLWIALTAPGRWVSDRFRRPPSPVG
jgi:hypothetical protein